MPVDGRAARALRTREAIVDACIAMVEEGDLRPTAPRVAERAGVSVRSVFQHFDDLPSLHSAVTQRIGQRMSALLVPPDTSQPLDARTVTFVQHRTALLEAVTPFRRAAQVHGPFAPEIRLAVAEGETYLSREVEATFAPELAGRSEADRRELLDALDAATSWAAWDVLRSDRGASVERARAVVARTLTALLAG